MTLFTGTASASGVTPNTFISRAVAVGGSITVNNTAAYAEVAAATGGPGTGGLDLTIAASASDVLYLSGCVSMNNTAVGVSFDFATIVSAAAVNWLGQSSGSNANNGIFEVETARIGTVGFSVFYTVQAGDITGGNVVLRFFYLSFAAVNRVLVRTATRPLSLGVANLRH